MTESREPFRFSRALEQVLTQEKRGCAVLGFNARPGIECGGGVPQGY